jgi:hypothetical protein
MNSTKQFQCDHCGNTLTAREVPIHVCPRLPDPPRTLEQELIAYLRPETREGESYLQCLVRIIRDKNARVSPALDELEEILLPLAREMGGAEDEAAVVRWLIADRENLKLQLSNAIYCLRNHDAIRGYFRS